jgi:hypothetical protein
MILSTWQFPWLCWVVILGILIGDWQLPEKYRASVYAIRLSEDGELIGWKDNRNGQSEVNICQRKQILRQFNGNFMLLKGRRSKTRDLVKVHAEELESRKMQLQYEFSKGHWQHKTVSRFFL